MSIDEQQIAHLARLARLHLDVQQQVELKGEITAMLDMVQALAQVNTEGVKPMAHPLELKQPCRADRVTETDQREQFAPLAPQMDDGLYLVPRVVD